MLSFVRNMIQLVLSPTSGWEDLSNADPDPKVMVQRFMLPTFGVAAVSIFVQLHYHPELVVSSLLIQAAAIFASLFIGYVVTESMMGVSSASWVEDYADRRRCSTVAVFAFSLLAMGLLVCNLLPVSLGLEYLLPLGVAMVVWRSTAYLGIAKKKEFSFMLRMVLTVVLLPGLVRALFGWISG